MSEYIIELKVAEVTMHFGILILIMPLMIYVFLFIITHNKKKNCEEKCFWFSFSNELLTITRTLIIVIISLFILTFFNIIKFETREYFKRTENSQKNTSDLYIESMRNSLQ